MDINFDILDKCIIYGIGTISLCNAESDFSVSTF